MSIMNKHITDLLSRSHANDVSPYDESFLEASLRKRMTETQCGSAEHYCRFLEHSSDERSLFYDSLRICYSEFFRNPLTFGVLERIVLPSLILKKKNGTRNELRIWSAACAAGQEAYSLAIVLEEFKIGSGEQFTYRIFATDRCDVQIREAQHGSYSASALGNINLHRASHWFTNHGDSYTVHPALKEHIDFSVFDLLSEHISCPPASIFGDFDLVVCANILFYYKQEHRSAILEKAGSCLARGGFIVTGEAEREIFLNHHYREAFPHSAIFRAL